MVPLLGNTMADVALFEGVRQPQVAESDLDGIGRITVLRNEKSWSIDGNAETDPGSLIVHVDNLVEG